MIAEGKHLVRVIGYSIGENGSANIKFGTPSGESVVGFFSFTDGAREYTIQKLLTLGYAGKDGTDLAKGFGSSVLNEKDEFEIVVKHKEYMGKTSPTVMFVNKPGGGGKLKGLTIEEAKVKLASMSLAGDFAAARAKMPKTQPTVPNVAKQMIDDSEEMPF